MHLTAGDAEALSVDVELQISEVVMGHGVLLPAD
jgi:hypothetical protein